MKTQFLRTAAAAGTLAATSLASMGPAFAADPWAVSANIGAVSNYIWRGATQTGDGPAIQGGIDVGHESGFYVGTWASNVDWDNGTQDVTTDVTGYVPMHPDTGLPVTDADGNYVVVGTGTGTTGGDPSPNYELDLYAGYDFAVNDDLSFGLSTIYYAYPDGRDVDFWEIGASGTYKWFTAGLAYTAWGEADDDAPYSEGDMYYYGSIDVGLPYDFGLSLRGGYYDFDTKEGGVDYGHGGVSISKEAGDFGTFSFNYDQIARDTYDDDPKFWVGWLKEF
ncbi:TorF family putative porin [Thiohalocapsa sp. ML1]|jgi:hypothetical protein|uniref:TorF family putative porin n=1 Tax=Thiohalocapsa sp. ML1 TaxID=1431688 RepID=UPI0007320150|nr:TorF family putative porin [Thiohalocapsa sp. ML1]